MNDLFNISTIHSLHRAISNQRSTSPKTRSIVPMMATMSACEQKVSIDIPSMQEKSVLTWKVVVSCEHVCACKMGKAGSTNLAPVRAVRAISDEVDTHFTLWRFDRTVSLAWWHSVTL